MLKRNHWLAVLFTVSMFILVLTAGAENKAREFPVLKGDYIGQSPPGMTPVIFAPGVISTELDELNAVFSPDGKEFYYAYRRPWFTIISMKQKKGYWQKPEVASFSGQYGDVDLCISPDGKKLFFCSNRPLEGNGPPKRDFDLWVTERSETGWSKPKHLGPKVNTDGNEFYPMVTLNGTLYFNAGRKDTRGRGDIYRAQWKNGEYSKPENLGDAINTEYHEHDAFIAADESFIIFTSHNRPEGFGRGDLYIGFKKSDGSWSRAVNMGPEVNSKADDFCAMVSPDRNYFFFTSNRNILGIYSQAPLTYVKMVDSLRQPGNGMGDIYWVDAAIIKQLKPKDLK